MSVRLATDAQALIYIAPSRITTVEALAVIMNL
jgi:hypothetical protein